MKKFSSLMLSLLMTYTLTSQAESIIYPQYYAQAQKIYQKMSLDERIGQLLLPSYMLLANSISPNGELCKNDLNNQVDNTKLMHDCGLDQIQQYHLGSVLTGGGPWLNAPTLENWAQLNQWAVQQHQLGSPNDPVILTGNDAIHGNMHLQGAVIFPHNIGLGVTHDPQLVYRIGLLVGQDSLASGFNWVYMPTIAVAQDLRWGRAYESYAQDPSLVSLMGMQFIKGLQDLHENKLAGPVATAKHFLGDGATQYGLDEGDDAYTGSEEDFWAINGQPYQGAVQANVGSIMVSYSAINGDDSRMTFGGSWDIINQFKQNGIIGTDQKPYRFTGFAVSDWNAPTRAAYFYDAIKGETLTLRQIMAKSINAGIDLIMLGQGDNTVPFDPNSPANFTNVGQAFDAIKTAHDQGLITDQRLEDAVTRLLAVKLAMAPRAVKNYAELQAKERQLALQAAQESLVLLKNQAVLPLKQKGIQNVILIGDTDDLGLQNGGWTVNWQGQKGSQYFTDQDKISSGATTLAEGIRHTLGDKINYIDINDQQTNLPIEKLNNKNSVAIALIAEVPYAEFMGDIGNTEQADNWYDMGAANQYNLYLGLPQSQFLGLQYSQNQASAIKQLRAKGIKVISVVYSGRPLILSEGKDAAPLPNSDAVIAAFLPGTLGGTAIANAIFGKYHFKANGASNSLTFPWPLNMQQVSDHFASGALFPVGYGLSD